jgi:N6-L-threonylcarbamoyladenine synthase
MLVLGIESSCDETALALVRNGREVVGSLVASQVLVHAVFGGVVPEIASREHLKVLAPMFNDLMKTSKVTLAQVDAVAVTQGPGLIGALLVGVSFAKGLALAAGKPLIPVDHVHAHIHGAMLGLAGDAISYPIAALVVSGGHTNLYIMPGPIQFELLASSIDDACGECFDKVAKLLAMPYPGGPEIEKLAAKGHPLSIPMPRMVERRSRLAFSYSGLKTFMANLINNEKRGAPEGVIAAARLADICAAFQEEALGQLVRKLEEVLKQRPEVRGVLIAGGVAANRRFRGMLQDKIGLPCFFPQPQYCSDNAAMIAALGYHHARQKNLLEFFTHDWDAYSRYDYAGVTVK